MRRPALALALVVVSCTQPSRSDAPARSTAALEALPAEEIDGALAAFAARPSVSSAELRARAMRTLISEDPKRALQVALNPVQRAALPADVQPFIEQWLDGVGDLDLIAGTSEDGAAPVPPERFLTLRGETFRAFVTGPRFEAKSRRQVRVHAVVLDELAAVSDRPTRLMTAGEPDDDSLPYRPGGQCPVSRKNVPKQASRVHAADAIYEFCTPDHVAAFDEQLGETEDQASDAPASAWSTGAKTVLFMRVDFDDLVGEPLSTAAAQTLIDTTSSNYFSATSYGQTSLTATVTPVFRLPQPSTFYKMNDNYYGLRSAAIAAATDAGYAFSSYSLDIVAFKGLYGGWAGRGSVGGRGNWLNGNFSARVTEHELGHNYGVWHANYWNATNSTIIGAGANQEYGNPFDVMGNGTQQFNAWFKKVLDWIPPSEIATALASGTYRIHALEQPITSGFHTLKVPRGDGQKDYWVEFRQAVASNRSLFNGVSINWGYASSTGSHLLDMTPGAPGGVADSALTYGRTFSDFNRGIHVTPLQKAGTMPEAIDVVVNIGAFPGNQPPTAGMIVASTLTPAVNAPVTFSIAASDPDGDALAYAWDFADDSYVPSAPMATHPFAAQRTYFVRCIVSDMKGGRVTRSVLVTVGTPARFTLGGTVTAGGTPVEGVRVGDATRVSYTDSDGKYSLSDVPDASVTLSAVKVDYAFTAGFASPVVVTGNLTGLDFTGSRVSGYSVSGTVVSSGTTGLAGVTVSDGTRSAVTAANGSFTLTGVPNGAWMLTAAKPGWSFAAKNVEVLGANVTGVQFTPSGAGLNGQILGGVTAAATVTDGLRTTTANGNGTNWFWNLSGVPSGTYNVVATLPGYTLTPTFTNPVTVAGSYVGNLHFNAVAGTSAAVSGTVTTGGVALPGATVSDGTRTSTTDSLGRFVLIGVPAGSYTLTPSHASYSFMPVTRMVTVGAANVTGQDFATTVVNPPPTVAMAATATPNPVTTGTSAVLSALGADDSGESSLRYTWSTSFFMAPSYSANGTNAAKTTTVTFARSGTYPFEVLIEDPGGLSVRSSVTVVVQQTLVSMTVNPPSANVLSGATQQFTAQGRDQFNQFMFAGPYSWAVSGGGSVSPTGLFTAGMTAGGPHTLTVTGGGKTGSAVVTVTSATSPMITVAARAIPSPVLGTSTSLTVGATDDGGEPALIYSWAMSAGPAAVTFSDNGTNAAKATTVTFTKAGAYQFVVSVVDGGGNMATSVVDVVVEQTPTTVQVAPGSTTVQPGAMLAFTASVEDQFGDSLGVQPALTWSVTSGGTVDANGVFTADAAPGGPYVVTASAGAVSGTATVTVSSAPDTRPPVVNIVAPAQDTRPGGGIDVQIDATDDVGVTGVALSLDGAAFGAELTSAPYSFMVNAAVLAPGAHLLVASARDAAGNTASSTPVRFFVGNGIDAPPVVTLSGVDDGGRVSGPLQLTVSATDDVAVMGLELLIDGVVAQTAMASPWSATVTLAAGAHTLQARATDTASQRGESALIDVTVVGALDMKPPEQLRGVCGCSSGALSPLLMLAAFALLRRRPKTRKRAP